ncbi:MAG: hypothetical protein RLP44_32265 [Aggregatilineales bacterium]
MDAGREARIRVAKEVFGLVVDRWYTAEQVKPELDHYVQSGILQALQERRLAKLIERVSQLPPAQITPEEVTRIMTPADESPVEDEQALQDRVAHQLEQVLGDYNNQDPEVIRMYGMMMQNPPRNDDELRRFCEYFVTTLPATSPNRATLNRYLSASAPQATYTPRPSVPPMQARPSTPQQPVQQRPPVQSVQPAQVSSRPYATPAPERSRVEPSRRPAPQQESGSLSGAFSGSFPGGCVWLVIYVVGLGIAGAIALLMFGAFLVQNKDFYQTEVGQGLGAATGYVSTGAGVFFWLRRQASSKLLMARFMVMLFGSAAVLYFVVSSGWIDVNALANSSASDREQLLGIGTMVVSGATTVFLWAKNLLRQLMWLAVLAVIGGGGLAFLFYTGAIDLDALLAGLR